MTEAVQVALIVALGSVVVTWLQNRKTRGILLPKINEVHALANGRMAEAIREIAELKALLAEALTKTKRTKK